MWNKFPPNISADERNYFTLVRDRAAELAEVLAEPLDPVGVTQLCISAIRLENAQNPHGLRYDDERRFADVSKDVLLNRGLNLIRAGLHAILKVCGIQHACEIPDYGLLTPEMFEGNDSAERLNAWLVKHAMRPPAVLDAKVLFQCDEWLNAGVRIISGRLAFDKAEPKEPPAPQPDKLTYDDIAKVCRVTKGWVEDHKKELGDADFPASGRRPKGWRSDISKVIAFIAAHGPLSVALTPDKQISPPCIVSPSLRQVRS